jgi:hypothetical protein
MSDVNIVSVNGIHSVGRVRHFKYTVVAADATNNYSVIDLSDFGAIDGATLQIYRSGININSDAVMTLNNNGSAAANGYIKIADGGSTYAATAGDIIYGTAFATE